MSPLRVLISGASVAGPSLAWWLGGDGHEVTVVERAPGLREGGFAVDFRGAVHQQVLERMGLLDEVRARQTHLREMTFVDETGATRASLPGWFTGGDVEILRGDLSRLLYDRTRDRADYRFGDSIAALTQSPDGVDVTFERGASARFDLVIGADGLHSKVRELVLGDERRFLRFGGYHVAGGFAMPNHLGLERRCVDFGVPGRSVSLASYHDPAVAIPLFVFASPPLQFDRRDLAAQKRILVDRYHDLGWEVPRILDALAATDTLYLDSISQVHVDRVVDGRVALIGDAGFGATMGGLGTGLAMVSACVLAAELGAANGDHRVAFPRYQAAIWRYAKGCQKLADGAGPFLAPPTAKAMRRRDLAYRVLTKRPFASLLRWMTTRAATAIELPQPSYGT